MHAGPGWQVTSPLKVISLRKPQDGSVLCVTLPVALSCELVTLCFLISLQLAVIVLWTWEESNSLLPLGACECEAC